MATKLLFHLNDYIMKNLVVEIPVNDIIVTGLNDRTVFNQSSLDELAGSIREQGILQNLVVRPNPKDKNTYQLVSGERRLKASVIAGIDSVPCLVKELTDKAFKEVMLIENLQREDLHPLEEAASIGELVKRKSNIKAVALKLGKAVKYIKERLSLNNLAPEAKQLFIEDPSFLLGHALILALFTHDQQLKAIDRVQNSDNGFAYFDNPVDLKHYVQQYVLLQLSKAEFDIKSTTLDKKTGACSSCKKQTGANEDLFSTITDGACCLDSGCFDHKTKLHTQINNLTLLKQFGVKIGDCLKVSNEYWTYKEGVLNSSKWVRVGDEDRCANILLGVLNHDGDMPVVIPVCAHKKCDIHFSQAENTSTSTIPENETKSESFKRRLKKRREKELTTDHHSARLDTLEQVFHTASDTINDWELTYIVAKLCSVSNANINPIAVHLGYIKEDEYIHYWEIDKFVAFLQKKGSTQMYMFMRMLITQENLNPENKFVASISKGSNNLVQHAESLDIDFRPLLKARKNLRKDDYTSQDREHRELVKKEKVRTKKIHALYQSAQEEYPELFDVIDSTKRETVLSTFSTEILSKMAFRLGLKRRKDADVSYYVSLINDGLVAIEVKLKS